MKRRSFFAAIAAFFAPKQAVANAIKGLSFPKHPPYESGIAIARAARGDLAFVWGDQMVWSPRDRADCPPINRIPQYQAADAEATLHGHRFRLYYSKRADQQAERVWPAE